MYMRGEPMGNKKMKSKISILLFLVLCVSLFSCQRCYTYYMESERYYDCIEDSPKYKAIEKEMEHKVDSTMEQLGYSKDKLGYCHHYWALKKRILKKEYKIRWKWYIIFR